MSTTTGKRGTQKLSQPTSWNMLPQTGKKPKEFKKAEGLDFSNVATKDTAAVTDISVIPTDNLTLAPRREYLKKVFKEENGEITFEKNFDSIQFGTPSVTINWDDDVCILVGILNSVKFHNIIGKTTRTDTKDALKLMCLVTGVDIATTNEEDKINADGVVTRAMMAYGPKSELLLTTYYNIMNSEKLSYLRNRRYFPPALKDLADARYVEANYKLYWDHLFKDNGFTTEELWADAFDYTNSEAYVYTLNYFHPSCSRNIEIFREDYQNDLDRAAAALLVVKEKRENIPFPTQHKRFGDRANKRHVYVMARNAWDEHVRLERQKEYLKL